MTAQRVNEAKQERKVGKWQLNKAKFPLERLVQWLSIVGGTWASLPCHCHSADTEQGQKPVPGVQAVRLVCGRY